MTGARRTHAGSIDRVGDPTDGEGDLKVPVRLLEQVELDKLASAEAAHGIGLIRQTHLLKVTVEVVTGLVPRIAGEMFLCMPPVSVVLGTCGITHLFICVRVGERDRTSVRGNIGE